MWPKNIIAACFEMTSICILNMYQYSILESLAAQYSRFLTISYILVSICSSSWPYSNPYRPPNATSECRPMSLSVAATAGVIAYAQFYR